MTGGNKKEENFAKFSSFKKSVDQTPRPNHTSQCAEPTPAFRFWFFSHYDLCHIRYKILPYLHHITQKCVMQAKMIALPEWIV